LLDIVAPGELYTRERTAAAPSHRDLSRICRDFTGARESPVPLTSKGALPYKPRDLKSAGDPNKWRFSGAEPMSGAAPGRSIGGTLHQAEKHP